MTKTYPEWDLEAYTQKEGDEHLDYYKELLPLIKHDPLYFAKYELDFTLWEYGDVDREERLKYIDKLGLSRELYPDYGFGQADLVRAICDDNITHTIASAGGRSGKTLSYYAGSITTLFQRPWSLDNPPRSPISIIIGSYREEHAIKIIMSEIRSRIKYSKNIKNYVVNSQQTMISFAQNLRIYTIPMNEVSKVQGQTNAIRIMVDEATRIKDEMIFPTIERMLFEKTTIQLADGTWYPYGVQMVLTSTPEGLNHPFAQEFMNASQNNIEGYKAIRWHSFDSPYYDYKKSLNSLLKPNANLLWWRQEFAAEFLTIANGFFMPELLDKQIDVDIGAWGDLEPTHNKLYWGIDWGEQHDSTVIWVMEDLGPVLKTKFVKELKGVPYDEQKLYIAGLARVLRPKLIKADSSERALNRILASEYKLPISPVEGVSMSLQPKHHLYHQAKFMLQAGLVICPPNRKWYEQMVGITTSKSMSGYTMFSDKAVGFDDFVDAFVLACSCKPVYGGYTPVYSIDKSEPTRKRDWSMYKPKSRVKHIITREDKMEYERKIAKRKKRK